MEKKFLFVLALMMSATFSIKAQHQVRYEADTRIELIEQAHKAAWNKINSVEGYRIQLLSVSGNNSHKNAQTVVEEFSVNYPDVPVYISYYEPYFRVRVGDYREKIDAEHDLVELKQIYTGAFIVKDNVRYR